MDAYACLQDITGKNLEKCLVLSGRRQREAASTVNFFRMHLKLDVYHMDGIIALFPHFLGKNFSLPKDREALRAEE